MKRKLLSLALALLLCVALSAAVFAAPDISGHYDATACEKDGNQYSYDNEYLELKSDGTGVITFGGTPYRIEWTISGSRLHLEDEEGYEMDGVYRDGVITGNYAGYDFTYEMESGATPAPAQSTAPSAAPAPSSSAAPAGQADLGSYVGVYQAISCEKDGASYHCDEDAIELFSNGTGTVVFNGKSYAMEWSLSGEEFAFADEDGDIMEGRLTGDRITGKYAGYDYVFERKADAVLPGWEYDGVVYGTYYPETVLFNGYSTSANTEYLVLNEDGSAMLVYSGCAFPSKWELSGDKFTLRDNRGSVMSGKLSDGILEATYAEYQYTYRKGDDAPIISLAPDSWNSGLPYVVDQAGLLSSSEVSYLRDTAESIASKYNCGVYIVTLDDMGKFSPSNNQYTCAEEIRVGYDLGFGSDRNCILLLMSMADRSYDLCVYGPRAEEVFNEYARSTIEDAMLDDFRGNDWYSGYRNYQSQCEKLLDTAATGRPISATNNPAAHARHVLVPLVIAFIVALIFCLVKKGKMRSVKQQQRAMNYIPDGGVNIAFRYDQYTHSTQVRVYDPPQSKSSSGGGGGGHSSSGHSHSGGHF